MAHYRNRHALALIENALKLSPLVGLIGHRQVGKTTLLEKIGSAYHVLDTRAALTEIADDPHEFLKRRAGKKVVLDECQMAPELFPELKEWVRTHKAPGQFLLSGSVRFSSREAIRESLTGRIVQVELLPLTLSEILETGRSDALVRMIQSERFQEGGFPEDRPTWARKAAAIEKYLQAGGLPGVCFLRDDKQRALRLEDQLLTILDRDLRLVRKITLSLTDLRGLVGALSDAQGTPLDYTALRKQTGISTPTIKKIISALEAVFLIRLLPIEGTSSRGTSVLFEDLAERVHVCTREVSASERFAHLCFHEARSQFQYHQGLSWSASHYRTRGGARIPFVFKAKQGELGLLPLDSPDDISLHSGSIRSFFAHFSRGKILALHPGAKPPRILNERVASAPLAMII